MKKVKRGQSGRIKYIPPAGSKQEVTHLWQRLVLAVTKFVMVLGSIFGLKVTLILVNVQAARAKAPPKTAGVDCQIPVSNHS